MILKKSPLKQPDISASKNENYIKTPIFVIYLRFFYTLDTEVLPFLIFFSVLVSTVMMAREIINKYNTMFEVTKDH